MEIKERKELIDKKEGNQGKDGNQRQERRKIRIGGRSGTKDKKEW
jgi:hypothetical protein